MKDDTDFFDELVGDDSDEYDGEELAGAFEGEDDDEDDEDEPSEVRTVVMSKNGMLALLSLKTTATRAMIVRVDPRQPVPTAQTYETGESAARWFRRSIATSRRNGWQVAYDGEPLFG